VTHVTHVTDAAYRAAPCHMLCSGGQRATVRLGPCASGPQVAGTTAAGTARLTLLLCPNGVVLLQLLQRCTGLGRGLGLHPLHVREPACWRARARVWAMRRTSARPALLRLRGGKNGRNSHSHLHQPNRHTRPETRWIESSLAR